MIINKQDLAQIPDHFQPQGLVVISPIGNNQLGSRLAQLVAHVATQESAGSENSSNTVDTRSTTGTAFHFGRIRSPEITGASEL